MFGLVAAIDAAAVRVIVVLRTLIELVVDRLLAATPVETRSDAALHRLNTHSISSEKRLRRARREHVEQSKSCLTTSRPLRFGATSTRLFGIQPVPCPIGQAG